MFPGMLGRLVEKSDIAAKQRHAEEREIDSLVRERKKTTAQNQANAQRLFAQTAGEWRSHMQIRLMWFATGQRMNSNVA